MSTLSPREEQHRHQSAILASLPEPRWENVPLKKMHLYDFVNDLEGASDARVALYRENWAPALCGAGVVHKHGEEYGIIDCRHRFLARRDQPGMFHCAVHEGLVKEQIIALFLFHNQHRRNPSSTEKYHAAVASGDPVARRVANVVAVRGVGSELRGFSACQAVVLASPTLDEGELALNFALRTLLAAFPATDPRRLDSTLIRAVGRFFIVHGANPKLNEERFIKALNASGRMTAAQVKAEGTSSGTSGPGAGIAIFRRLEDRYASLSSGNRL